MRRGEGAGRSADNCPGQRELGLADRFAGGRGRGHEIDVAIAADEDMKLVHLIVGEGGGARPGTSVSFAPIFSISPCLVRWIASGVLSFTGDWRAKKSSVPPPAKL